MAVLYRTFASFSIIVSLLGCNNADDRVGYPGPIHPDPALLQIGDDIDLVIGPFTTQNHGEISFDPGPVLYTVGHKNEALMGHIVDAALDQQNNLYVFDERFNNVRIFDSQGGLIGQFGGPGQGPDEFQVPASIDFIGQDRIAVLDRTRHVKIFQRVSEGRYELATTFTTDIAPESLCVIGDRIYIQGLLPRHTFQDGSIHVYDMEGHHITSFGYVYHSPKPIVENTFSIGKIACAKESGLVALSLRYLPFVFVYGTDGRLKWSAQVADFIPIDVKESTERGDGLDMRFAEGSYLFYAIKFLGPDRLILQVLEITHTGSPSRKHTAVLNISTGSIDYLGTGFDFLVGTGPSAVAFYEIMPSALVHVLEKRAFSSLMAHSDTP